MVVLGVWDVMDAPGQAVAWEVAGLGIEDANYSPKNPFLEGGTLQCATLNLEPSTLNPKPQTFPGLCPQDVGAARDTSRFTKHSSQSV